MAFVSRGTRIDTEKCVENIGNRFQLIIIAAARARELSQQNRHSDRHEHLHTPVTALLEVQSGELTISDIRRVR